MLAGPGLLIVVSLVYYLLNAHYSSTDNAYVRQDKVSVGAEVGGRIVEVAVRENQRVKAGDLLFRIDPEPYQLAVAEADAAIANAEARLDTLQTNYATSDVDIDKAKKDVAFFETEYQRQQELMKKHVTTKAALDAAEHALSEARSKLESARADAAKARAALSTGHLRANENPAVLAARVQKDKALLNLARTEIRAPVDGIVSQTNKLQIGQLMVQGLAAVSIVKDDVSWVEANFKETDLEDMRVDQPAVIEVDSYPGMKLKGHVESIGAGTGSEFSILPAQNATGNWVKVTQRVPVRIAIDDKPSRPLIAGLSVYVRVNTRK
ncbi:MAG TPA: HlyD family secretion protein [Spongiibacteraceae bacterium]|nr:HlyD family secretion protein [Spongiibacteraceae bacterium]